MEETTERRISWVALGLAAITFLALVLRLFHLGHQSLWYDEGFSVYLSSMSLAEIWARTAADIHPPFYYFLLHFWLRFFGSSESSLRFLSLIFGLLTVPLVYGVGRRLFDATTGLMAAFFVAISPLYLWYSQEGRMYTLVTFLGLLSSYLFLQIMERADRNRRGRNGLLWAGYVVTNVIAVYTHFYTFFVVAFQLAYGLWPIAYGLWPIAYGRWRREGSALLKLLGAQALILAAYLPWSQYVIVRYGADVSYWAGTLPLSEVLRKTLLTFSTGHTVIEATAQPISLGYLALLLLGLAALWTGRKSRTRTPNPYPLFFSLLYLLVPVALLYLVSYQRPKFHPRYLVLASPPFFLLLAGGLVALYRLAKTRSQRAVSSLFYLASGLAFLYITVTSAYADFNSYFDARFTKDDFRGVADHIESRIQDDEVVILTSGHLFPVFTYYYDEDNWYPIPDEPTLSTERVLNYGLADDLNRILAGKSGAWVVLWQDEVVDPNGFLTMMLGEEGEELPTGASFWQVKLRHYRLPKGAHFSAEPQIQHPVAVNFDDKVELLGYTLPEQALPADEGVQVTLYWQARQELEEDYKLSLRLRDEAGHFWGRLDRRPTSYLYPTMRWRVGEALFGECVLPLLPGTPPGQYQLEVNLYSEGNLDGLDILDPQGTPTGKSTVIGTVLVARTEKWPSVADLGIQNRREVDFGQRITLLGYEIDRGSAQPGDTLHLTIFWQARETIDRDYALVVRLVDGGGRSVGERGFPLANETHPTSRWVANEVLRGQYDFVVPVEAQAGQGQLQVALVDEAGQSLGQPVVLTPFEVEATERVFTVPQTQYPSGANLGDLVTLIGADLDAEAAKPGDTLHLTLYWQAKVKMDVSYTVFTHLLDEGSQIRAQKDSIPLGGARPTTGWVPQEVIVDEYDLVIAADAPPGEYVIEVGMYDAATSTFERLPVLDEAGTAIDNRVLLGVPIRIGE